MTWHHHRIPGGAEHGYPSSTQRMVCYYVASVTNHSEESPVSLNINKSTPEDSVSGVQLVSVDSLERVTLKRTWLNMKAEHFHVICALNGFRAREVFRDIMWNISSSSVIHDGLVLHSFCGQFCHSDTILIFLRFWNHILLVTKQWCFQCWLGSWLLDGFSPFFDYFWSVFWKSSSVDEISHYEVVTCFRGACCCVDIPISPLSTL